jgi:hypothetical protein
MEPKRYAMVRDNVVYNVCLWNGDVTTWQPPDDGTIMIANDWAGVGDWWEESEQRFYRALPTNDEMEYPEEVSSDLP